MAPKPGLQTGHLTVDQRGRICKKSKQNPTWNQEKVAKWAELEFGLARPPNQGTISRILRREGGYQDIPKHLWALKRLPNPREPVLDRALAGWVLQKQIQKASLTGDLIKEKAKSFARQMALENPPKFSNGWLLSFQLRHAFRSFVAHGESGNAGVVPTADLDGICQKILQYSMERVFNFDELGLFYRLAPDPSIATRQILGAKKDKTRMTIGLMVNMVGLDRDMIFIGHAKKPRCFEKKSAEKLGFFYKSNKSAWMMSLFFQDVVKRLNDQAQGSPHS
jgi:hypothetical protein